MQSMPEGLKNGLEVKTLVQRGGQIDSKCKLRGSS